MGTVPTTWRLSPALDRLDMNSNKLSGPLPSGWDFSGTRIVEIDLYNNFFSGPLTLDGWVLPSLDMLMLGFNR